jgi:hypothetical protein
MALIKQVSIDGEDVEIDSLSDAALLSAIQLVAADLVAAALSGEGKPFSIQHSLHETEYYRKPRVRQLTAKHKALVLLARRRKLEVD